MDTALQFKTKPWQHQLEAFERFKDEPYSALLFEQRCGKSLAGLMIAAHKFLKQEIDSLLIVAPNGVQRNWITEEIPTHLPVPYRSLLWQSSRMGSVKVKREMEELLACKGVLRILSVNVDALITTAFRAYLTKFFFRRRVMTIIDESSDIANQKSARSKQAIKIGRRSKVRMILDGTPVASGPLGLFNQCDFLSPDALGFSSFTTFRARYAEMETRDVGERDRLCPLCFNDKTVKSCSRCRGVGFVGKNQIQVVKSYLNLGELQENLRKFSHRVLRSDCHDLPPKIRQKVFFDLPPDIRRVYDQLRSTFIAELKSGGIITAPLVLTRYLRLQQVGSGFLPIQKQLVACPVCQGGDNNCEACQGVGVIEDEADQGVEPLGTVNARLNALTDQLEKLSGQCIIWTRFTYDANAIMEWMKNTGRKAVRYDGAVKTDERAANVKAFQNREATYFVGSPRAGGRGLDLPADIVAYYSHYWSLRTRLQSEDRAQSLKRALEGQEQSSVLYLDFIAAETVDEKIVTALREGKEISDLITGDKPEEWL